MSQFLDLSCDGASDALEKIQRLPSINDPENMELSYGKLMSETEITKPSRYATANMILPQDDLNLGGSNFSTLKLSFI